MKSIDNFPEPLSRFLYAHAAVLKQHLDFVVLTWTGETELEVTILVPLSLPRERPADEPEGITDRFGERHVIFHVDDLQRTFPRDLLIVRLTKVMVEVEGADAEDQQVARGNETAVNVHF